MHSITERQRKPSPGGRPQPLAYLDGILYVGSLDTSVIYEIETASWHVRAQSAAPGRPYGMAVLDGTVRVVVSIGEEDDRYLHTFVPGKGFDPSGIALPGLSGSHLASDGSSLYLLQIGNRCIVTFDADGRVKKQTALAQRLAGIGFANGKLYGLAGDEEFEHLHLAEVDLRGTEVAIAEIASISDEARGLTHDGNAWWTCYRDNNQIASFSA